MRNGTTYNASFTSGKTCLRKKIEIKENNDIIMPQNVNASRIKVEYSTLMEGSIPCLCVWFILSHYSKSVNKA